ncbi:MAG: DegQ family serine endoprotease [Calditrichia bacterium]
MEIIKKIFVVIVALILIGAVAYLIYISQMAQEKREVLGEVAPEERGIPPREEPIEMDTLQSPAFPLQPDTVQESIVPRDTIRIQRVPKAELQQMGRVFLGGNPNPIFISAAKKIIPAVVTLENKVLVNDLPDDEAHRFFRDKFGDEEGNIPRPGSGSGIVISPNGYILTNFHVIEKAVELKVVLYDKREFPAEYIGGDPNIDIALLKIDATNLPSAYIGDSDSVQIGEWVMAVGSPLNFSFTITAGIISALGRDISIINERYRVENFIQTDAVINPGNSGGALVNLNGEVIGINTAITTRTGLYQGYGFAIPINLAIKVVNDILKYGEVRRGLLGVEIGPVDNTVANAVGLSRPIGALIQRIEPNSPAEKAGLQQGDIILKVDGSEVVSVNDLQIKIARRSPEEKVNLEVWRDRRKTNIQVILGKAPVNPASKKIKLNQQKLKYRDLGLEVRNLSSAEKREYQTEYGVSVEEIKAGSPAQNSGISPNDILLSINDVPIQDTSAFREILSNLKSGEIIKITIRKKRFGEDTIDRIVFIEYSE